MLKQTDVPAVGKAVNVIYDYSEDTRIREMARIREKTLHDRATELLVAEQKGMEKGIKKGRAEGIAQMVENMRKSGLSEELIQSILNNN